MSTQDGTYGTYSISGTTGGFNPSSITTPTYPNYITTTDSVGGFPLQCSAVGHNVERWAEYLDGECVGYCTVCDTRVQSQRMPGGMPFMRLKALLELLIASPDDAGLFLEINDITDLLDLEEQALAEARSLLGLARKMAGCDEEE